MRLAGGQNARAHNHRSSRSLIGFSPATLIRRWRTSRSSACHFSRSRSLIGFSSWALIRRSGTFSHSRGRRGRGRRRWISWAGGTQRSRRRGNAYMLSSMSDSSFVLDHPRRRRWAGCGTKASVASRVEQPAQRRAAIRQMVLVEVPPPATFQCCLGFLLLLSLLGQGTEAGAPAQGAPVGCASSINSRTVCSQSVAQLEPRTSSAPNSNRCLNGGLGHQFVCIRLS